MSYDTKRKRKSIYINISRYAEMYAEMTDYSLKHECLC